MPIAVDLTHVETGSTNYVDVHNGNYDLIEEALAEADAAIAGLDLTSNYEIQLFVPGLALSPDEILGQMDFRQVVQFEAGLANCSARADKPFTEQRDYVFLINGTLWGMWRFGAGGTVGTPIGFASYTSVIGDVLKVQGPSAAPDATGADVSFSVLGEKV